MYKISYSNMPKGASKIGFFFRYVLNLLRTWYLFNFKFPWVEYKGFVRVMPRVEFVKGKIQIGHNVQFGKGSLIATDVIFGNYILIAANVSFIGKNDHSFCVSGTTIWDSPRGLNQITIVKDDVWIGDKSIIMSGLTIGEGSIVAAGSLVNKSIPPCEIWGGVPAIKIKDRFSSLDEKNNHMRFIKTKFNV
jgi:acetyltransferase-like isoleucine patch superfamily enzyme